MTMFRIEFFTSSQQPVWVDPIGWDWHGLPRARRIDNGKNFSVVKSTDINNPHYWNGPYLAIKTPHGEQLLQIRATTSGKKPDFLFDGIHIYCGENPTPLKPGFMITYDRSKKLIRIYAPTIHEANYARKDYGRDPSLLEKAVRGQLHTGLAAHKNMFHTAHFLAGLAAGNKRREADIHAALTYFNGGKAAISSVNRGLTILSNPAPHSIELLRPVMRNLKLTPRAIRFISGGTAVSSNSINEKQPPIIQLPSADPKLFTLALMAKPHEAASLFNFTAFFYDMIWDKGINYASRNIYNSARTQFRRMNSVFNFTQDGQIIPPDQLTSPPGTASAAVSNTSIDAGSAPKRSNISFSQRHDGGFFAGVDGISPVGGAWGQFRSFISWDPANPKFGKFHIRLLNYAGISTPNGVLDAGLFQVFDVSARFNFTTGEMGNWTQSLGLYAILETSFPLGDRGAVRRAYERLTNTTASNRFTQGALWLGGEIKRVFSWAQSNVVSGVTHTLKQLFWVQDALEENSRKLSDRFGAVDGQLAGYAGLTLTTNLAPLSSLRIVELLGAQLGGAVVGGAAGYWMSYGLGLVQLSPRTAASIADAAAEAGSLLAGIGFAAAAKTGATLSADWGAIGFLGARSKQNIASAGTFYQANVNWSQPLHTFT